MRGLLTGLAALAGLVGSTSAMAAPPTDPLGSPLWDMHAERLFGKDKVVFDPAVHVDVPVIAENQHVFPMTLDARALGTVKRIIVLVDLDPLPLPVDFTPGEAAPWLSLRIKLDQRTPVRVAAQTPDGTWHVAGVWVDAAGGGCSAPPVSRAKGDWAQHLGEVRGAVYRSAQATRIRFAVRHPMDTGLVENIPAYNIETIRIMAGKQELSHMAVTGSVSEDPAFTMLLPAGEARPLTIAMHDSNGRDFDGILNPAEPEKHP